MAAVLLWCMYLKQRASELLRLIFTRAALHLAGRTCSRCMVVWRAFPLGKRAVWNYLVDDSYAGGAITLAKLMPTDQVQTYPSRPVHLIEGFGAGGTPGILARLLGQWLAERCGQPFVALCSLTADESVQGYEASACGSAWEPPGPPRSKSSKSSTKRSTQHWSIPQLMRNSRNRVANSFRDRQPTSAS